MTDIERVSGGHTHQPEILLELLRATSHELSQARGTNQVLWTIAETSIAILGYEDCVIYLVDKERDVLVQRAAFGPKCAGRAEILNPIEIPIGDGIVGAVAASGRRIRVDDTRDDPRYIVDDAERRSELAVPILDDGEVIGVIDSEHSEPSFYTEHDEQALVDLAALAAARVRASITIEELERARAALDELASTDPLTGLPNRRAFEDHLAIMGRQRPAIGLIDLDGFKRINDEYGHGAGDDLLRHVASVLQDATRQTDLVARLGGDEFAVVLDSGDVLGLEEIMDRLVSRIGRSPWGWGGGTIQITASGGVARGGDHNWADADAALYLAKQDGKNQVVAYDAADPRLGARAEAQLLAILTRDGLADGRFTLFGQPIVETTDVSDTPTYVEALLRYVDDDGSFRAPVPFLEAAEQYGLTERIDRWVIDHVVEWLATHEDAPPMSLNVHPQTIVSGEIVPHLGRAMDRWGLGRNRLLIEITEAAAIGDEARYRDVVETFRGWGVRVALDDFGSGWTSLAVARTTPVDVLKIDGAWVREATTDPLCRQVVEAIAGAAKTLGALTVAEWVEDDETRRFLEDLGVDYVQGWLTGRPQPLDELLPAVQSSPSV